MGGGGEREGGEEIDRVRWFDWGFVSGVRETRRTTYAIYLSGGDIPPVRIRKIGHAAGKSEMGEKNASRYENRRYRGYDRGCKM